LTSLETSLYKQKTHRLAFLAVGYAAYLCRNASPAASLRQKSRNNNRLQMNVFGKGATFST
jgi:hypothetical protein